MNDYQELALRTESPVNWDMETRALRHLRLLHGVMGLCTEAVELHTEISSANEEERDFDIVNIKEELGDLEWYMALIKSAAPELEKQVYDLHEWSAVGQLAEWTAERLIQFAGDMLDQLKRIVFYGSAPDWTKLASYYSQVAYCLAHVADCCDLTINEIQEANIAKLQKRYPEKFTDFHAVNRDLAEERKVLEGVDLGGVYKDEIARCVVEDTDQDIRTISVNNEVLVDQISQYRSEDAALTFVDRDAKIFKNEKGWGGQVIGALSSLTSPEIRILKQAMTDKYWGTTNSQVVYDLCHKLDFIVMAMERQEDQEEREARKRATDILATGNPTE